MFTFVVRQLSGCEVQLQIVVDSWASALGYARQLAKPVKGLMSFASVTIVEAGESVFTVYGGR